MVLLNYHSCAYPATARFAALISPAVQPVPLHSAAILNQPPASTSQFKKYYMESPHEIHGHRLRPNKTSLVHRYISTVWFCLYVSNRLKSTLISKIY